MTCNGIGRIVSSSLLKNWKSLAPELGLAKLMRLFETIRSRGPGGFHSLAPRAGHLGRLLLCQRNQLGNPDQIVGNHIEHEIPGHAANAAVLGLPHRPVLFTPAVDALKHP